MKTAASTVAAILRRFGDEFIRRCRPQGGVYKTMHRLARCRTAALGGHLYRCSACGEQTPVYNSCQDRHCPLCQSMAREQWLDARREDLLELPYFHTVFTVPHELNGLTLQNKRELYNLLFRSVAETLLKFGRTHLNGQVGFMAVLHTWDQTLGLHPHIHVLIPAGALDKNTSSFTRGLSTTFLFPVRAMANVFRGVYLEGLKILHAQERLTFHGQCAELEQPAVFRPLLETLYQKTWNVYAKKPFGGADQVLAYLGRYTHRVAISNDRILGVDEDNSTVTFSYRDRRDADRKKSMTFSAVEFLRRFFLHHLPSGFTRIRHYGFLSNSTKTASLETIRKHLNQSPPPPSEDETKTDRLLRYFGADFNRCACCGKGRMEYERELPSQRATGPPWPNALTNK